MYILISFIALLFVAIIIGDRLAKGEARQAVHHDPWAAYNRPAYLRRRR
jgi:hypothetical protein